MSYQVIARKWRPQTFEEVTGQEHITRTLRNAVEHERLHHAYLFSGARGVGKTTTARLLAKAVNCHKSDRPTPTPCRTTDPEACPSCREIAEGRSIDVLEIDAASNTGVDNVRDAIINTVGTRPARDRYKVFIIDEVHMLSVAAFNALLKTLEEPPPGVLFIMATTHPHKVPETILSRSQQFEFRTIAASKIAERLRLIADAEKIKVSDEALREIARAGEGSMRDAQSAFDQVISFSEGKIEASDVEAALGLAGRELLARVMRAVAEQKPADALAVVEELTARGHELRNFCRDLLSHLRDLLVVKIAGDAAMPDLSAAERKELQDEARDFSESDLVRFFNSLTETETRLGSGSHPRYQLEVGLVKLVEMRRLAPLGQIVERLNALEEALRTGRAPAGGAGGPQTPPAVPPTSAPPRRGAAGGGGAASFSPSEEFSPSASAQSAAAPALADSTPVRTDSTPAPRAPAAPNLKLVPPPLQTGGAAAFAVDAAARASEAPFALGDGAGGEEPARPFVEGARAGEDRVGQPVSLVASAPESNAAAAPARTPEPRAADSRAEAGGKADVSANVAQPVRAQSAPEDPANAFKRGLEERGKPLLAVALDGARLVWVEGDEVRVDFPTERKHLHDTLKKPENQKLLREVCCEVLGRQVGINIKLRAPGEADDEQSTAEDEARREQRLMREKAESHPVVQKVLKTFRAEIVDVRRRSEDATPTPPQQQ
ncbi:MAG TPA: DNA polymerase III subunit gamma/tau [Pyrinomonadaceae bacterium]|nr:DNA polymerase III subunit gamma/tau [Pyrinomonadaceae bacterium]